LTILIQTDSKPEQNSFKLFSRKKIGDWEEKLSKSNLKRNQVNRFDKCLFFKSCIRFEIYDTAGDGITGGYYTIYFDGTYLHILSRQHDLISHLICLSSYFDKDVKKAHSQFDNGGEVVKFGIDCDIEETEFGLIMKDYPSHASGRVMMISTAIFSVATLLLI